jgi:hypothetical protein
MSYSKYFITESTLTSLANAVKSLYNTTSSLTISEMISAGLRFTAVLH